MPSKEKSTDKKTKEPVSLMDHLGAFLRANFGKVTGEGGYRFSYKKTAFQATFNNDGFYISICLAEYYEHVEEVLKGIKTINKGLDKKLLARMMERDAYIGVEAVARPKNYSDKLAMQMIEDIITVKDMPEVKAFVEQYGEAD